jgi:transcriptional regulator
MYNIPYYKAEDEKEVITFMRHHPFIILTGADSNHHPVATHIPVLIEEREEKLFLLAHVVKQSDHHKAFVQNPNVLAIFSGAHAYVSASWYTNQQQASTWNYQAVHARGQLKFVNDDGLLNILHRLTEHFENDPASPSLVKNLADDYVSRLTKAIVGFEIEVTEIAHIFKLSQNRDKESYNNIIQHLKDGDSEANLVASTMEKRRHDD